VPHDQTTLRGIESYPTELFVNPLMVMYYAFDLNGLARHVHYLDSQEGTRTLIEVGLAIEEYHDSLSHTRPRPLIPH
jgi:hypothetical protein